MMAIKAEMDKIVEMAQQTELFKKQNKELLQELRATHLKIEKITNTIKNGNLSEIMSIVK